MLRKNYVRDGNRRIIGSVTSGYSDESAVVRNEGNRIVGRTSERFHTTLECVCPHLMSYGNPCDCSKTVVIFGWLQALLDSRTGSWK